APSSADHLYRATLSLGLAERWIVVRAGRRRQPTEIPAVLGHRSGASYLSSPNFASRRNRPAVDAGRWIWRDLLNPPGADRPNGRVKETVWTDPRAQQGALSMKWLPLTLSVFLGLAAVPALAEKPVTQSP